LISSTEKFKSSNIPSEFFFSVSEGNVQICGEQFKWSLLQNIQKPDNGSSVGVGIRPEM